MLFLLLLGALASARGSDEEVVNGTATMESRGLMMAFDLCAQFSGLNSTVAFDFVTNITAEKFKEQCLYSSQYQKAWHCFNGVVAHFMNNSVELQVSFPGFEIMSSMDVLCNDSLVQPECLAEYSLETAQLNDCANAHESQVNTETTDPQLRACLLTHIAIKCSKDLLSQCDVHTATVLENNLKSAIAVECDLAVIIG